MRRLLPLILLLALASGCTGSRTGKPAVEVNVWAASSLKDALTKLAPDFEKDNNAKLVFNFASSGDLQTQIEQGARADVFLSAGKKQMDALARKNLIDPASRANFLGNNLVVAVPSAGNVKIAKVEDIAALPGIRHIAVGNPSEVPAGKYAQQSLETANIFKAVKLKLVLAKDVRQVLAYLETGDADLGFVYASDLKVAKNVKNALTVPDTYHDPIVYPLAVVRGGKQPKPAAKFTDYIRSKPAQKIFADYGFKPAAN
ncbi:MAG: molybdate ABC transporter substrate-binding protein [Actinomycetota bacterium]|nr:molybdate ABC transporter substrate-binding protein [Actinomycetota bacterium]